MEKLDACTSLSIKPKLFVDTWKPYHTTLVHQQNIWRTTKVVFLLLKLKIGIPTVKHIDIPVYFLQNNFDNGLFIPKYYKSSVMLADMSTKPCSGTIISGSNKWMTGFRLYPISNTNTINS